MKIGKHIELVRAHGAWRWRGSRDRRSWQVHYGPVSVGWFNSTPNDYLQQFGRCIALRFLWLGVVIMWRLVT